MAIPQQDEDVVEHGSVSAEVIEKKTMPKWLWGVMGAIVIAAILGVVLLVVPKMRGNGIASVNEQGTSTAESEKYDFAPEYLEEEETVANDTPRPTSTPRPTNTSVPTFTPVPDSAILYYEDFEDGVADGWVEHFGYWDIVEDDSNYAYQGISGSWINSYLEAANWRNFGIQVRVKQISLTSAAFIRFRNSPADIKEGYTLYFDKNYVVLGTNDGDTVLASHPFTLLSNKWYTVVIEIQENHFKINFDSETVLDVTDKDDTYPTGGLGFWVREGNDFLFDDIKVWNLE